MHRKATTTETEVITMADDLWNAQLTRENFKDFYMSTVVMVYPSVYKITKEATRCENAIVKSYLDVYSKRAAIPGDKVIYVFGDILLENAKHIVEEYPLPADMTYSDRLLDEYTRNSMLEKITAKIDSRTFKMAEFISTDVKKTGMTMVTRKKNDIFAVTPLLGLEIIVLSVIIWMVSYAAVTVPYTKDVLINEKGIFENSSVQEQFISAMGYFPLNVKFVEQTPGEEGGEAVPEGGETEPAQPEAQIAASLAETTEPEISATSG